MMNRKTALAGAATALCLIAGAASAQTTYSNRTAFTASAGGVSTETFSGCGTATAGFSGSLSSTSGPCSGILPGVTYSVSNGGLFIAGPGQSSNPTTALGVNTPSGGALNIAFAQTQSAFGADLFQNFGGGSQQGTAATFTLNFLLGGSNVGTYTSLVAPNGGGFFGLTGTSFDTVTVSQAGGFAVVDNVSFAAGAVPEPATWAMMVVGFGALGFAVRRRQPGGTRIRFA